jgi:hypothetical protein
MLDLLIVQASNICFQDIIVLLAWNKLPCPCFYKAFKKVACWYLSALAKPRVCDCIQLWPHRFFLCVCILR